MMMMISDGGGDDNEVNDDNDYDEDEDVYDVAPTVPGKDIHTHTYIHPYIYST